MLTTFTAPAFAKTWYIEDGDITISASETKGTNKVSQGAEPEVEDTGTIITNREKDASSHTVTINAGNDKVEVTLDNVNIKADSGSALISKGDVTLTLKGDNHLTGANGGSSSYGGDGITSSGSLTISGGTVTATGGDSTSSVGSGGSGIYSVSGDVTISGGTVNANGGDGKNGSGGGSGIDSSGGVTVSGGTVTANGGDSKDGDGGSGGYGISSSGVAISGGTVTANGGDGGSGSGSHGGNGIYSSSGVAISGGAVTANGGDSKDGSGGNGIYSSGGVTISSGSTVTANGGDGEDGSGGRGITSNGGVTVSGGTVNAKGGSGKNGNGGDGIRSFNPVAISGGTVNANGGNSDYSNGGDGIRSLDHVAISGGTVKSNGGSGNLSGGNGIISYDIDLSGSLELTAKAGSPNGKALSRVGSELDLNTIKDKLDPGAKVTATDADGKVIQQVSIPRPVEPEEPSSSSDSGSATPSAPASFLPGLTVTDKDGQRISYTSTQSGNTLTVCVGRFTASLRISLAALRQLRAEGIETITFQTILCSTTLSVDELLAMGGEDAEVVLTHHIRSSTLTVGGKAV
ncbi:MAG: hypothetical protein KH074_11285 [Faecalibacterium prausnitzii]|nr:hypothetical protein [Faecalibacterium prausnitzii]